MSALERIKRLVARLHPEEWQISEYVAGRLSESQREAVQTHFSWCQQCREIADVMGLESKQASSSVVPIRQNNSLVVGKAEASSTLHKRRVAPSQQFALAAADTSGPPSDGSLDAAPFVEYVPGAVYGEARLGFWRGGSSNSADVHGADEVVVTGALDAVVVVIGGQRYELSVADGSEPRAVVGMSHQDLMIWVAKGKPGGFRIE